MIMSKGKKNDDMKPLWAAYKKKGCAHSRQKLINHYASLVKYVVGRVMIYLPPFFESDDLTSYGIIGLIDAVENFDPQQGVKFATYGVLRIKGAIYDALRSQDWVPRSVREKSKKLAACVVDLEQKLKRSPSDSEIAQELQLNKTEYDQLLSQVSIPQVLSLNSLLTGGEKEEMVPQDIPDSAADNPVKIVEKKDLKNLVAKTIDRLNAQEKMVVTLYYYEELTLREIGEVMNLSTARISQIHTSSILRLRGMLSREKQSLFDT